MLANKSVSGRCISRQTPAVPQVVAPTHRPLSVACSASSEHSSPRSQTFPWWSREGLDVSVARGCRDTEAQASEDGVLRQLGAVAGALVAATVLTCSPAPAFAAEGKAIPEAVYFGNGCFWGRQYDFVNTEQAMGRQANDISAVVGYAGGKAAGPDGKVCYYLADPRTVYEKLGHAEVVQVSLKGPDDTQRQEEFRRFAKTYFQQFQKTRLGMLRLDPQDAGPGYRNVIGIPGGVNSPLYQVLKEENVNNMELRVGNGNEYVDSNGVRKPTEDDLFNVVWVVDSDQLPFYQAERYHQFHNGIGKLFPLSYTLDLKNQMRAGGKLQGSGCPELPF